MNDLEKLHNAIKRDEYENMKQLLKKQPELINDFYSDLVEKTIFTALGLAIYLKKIQVIRFLLKYKPDLNHVQKFADDKTCQQSALFTALRSYDLSLRMLRDSELPSYRTMITLLLANNACLDNSDRDLDERTRFTTFLNAMITYEKKNDSRKLYDIFFCAALLRADSATLIRFRHLFDLADVTVDELKAQLKIGHYRISKLTFDQIESILIDDLCMQDPSLYLNTIKQYSEYADDCVVVPTQMTSNEVTSNNLVMHTMFRRLDMIEKHLLSVDRQLQKVDSIEKEIVALQAKQDSQEIDEEPIKTPHSIRYSF